MSDFRTPVGAEEEVDYLEVDSAIPGQSYCCISFISPEKVIVQKDRFFLQKFLKDVEKSEKTLDAKTFETEYDDYVAINEKDLENAYHSEVSFKTSVRGLKVRGVYNTYEEAAKRAESLQRSDRAFHVYVGQVGYWLPWDPNADNVDNQEYMEKELNELMKNYQANPVQKYLFYSNQVDEMKRKAAAEQLEKKEKNDADAARESA
jgi:hypothetical protein